MRAADPSEADLAALERSLTEIERKRANLARRLAMLDDAAADPVLRELATLAAQKRQLEGEREVIAGRRGTWQLARARLDDLTSWCRKVGDRLGRFSYAEKRLALMALRVKVRVYSKAHTPRWVIDWGLPLDESDPATGQVENSATSGCSVRAAPGWSGGTRGPGQRQRRLFHRSRAMGHQAAP